MSYLEQGNFTDVETSLLRERLCFYNLPTSDEFWSISPFPGSSARSLIGVSTVSEYTVRVESSRPLIRLGFALKSSYDATKQYAYRGDANGGFKSGVFYINLFSGHTCCSGVYRGSDCPELKADDLVTAVYDRIGRQISFRLNGQQLHGVSLNIDVDGELFPAIEYCRLNKDVTVVESFIEEGPLRKRVRLSTA